MTTKEQVIGLAKKAGFFLEDSPEWDALKECHERFATLVRNAALEELSEKCAEKLTRADWNPSSIFRHYYPSANGDWVDLRELKKFIESLKEPT
jgi:hypothetical protein